MYLTWGEPPQAVAQKIQELKRRAARTAELRFGIRLHVIVRDTTAEAWRAAHELLARDRRSIAGAADLFAAGLGGSAPHVGAARRAARQARGQPQPMGWGRAGARRRRHCAGRRPRGRGADAGISRPGHRDVYPLGYPHLEEAYRLAESVFPLLPATPTGVNRFGNTGPFGETVANESRPAESSSAGDRGGPIIRLAEILPRGRAGHLPGIGGFIPWILPISVMIVWQIACSTGYVPTRVLPAPTDVVLAGWKSLQSGELARNIWVSFWCRPIGFLIGGGIGFAFGLSNGLSQLSDKLTDTTLQMVRNIPHLALILPRLSCQIQRSLRQSN